MGYTPESTDDSIYTLRRRIPTRPMDQNTPEEHHTVRKSEQRAHSLVSASRLNSLIGRLLPTVRALRLHGSASVRGDARLS